MTQATPQVQITSPELSDHERRRRLAAVYRLLIDLGQRENRVGAHGASQEPAGDQMERTVKSTDRPSL